MRLSHLLTVFNRELAAEIEKSIIFVKSIHISSAKWMFHIFSHRSLKGADPTI
jgi:hypothetical protein